MNSHLEKSACGPFWPDSLDMLELCAKEEREI